MGNAQRSRDWQASDHRAGERSHSTRRPLSSQQAPQGRQDFLRWCVGRAILDISPAKGLAAPAGETPRDRVLDDDELAHIIGAARQIDGSYGGIVELLALTGQRREEVAQLTWDEIDLASQTWTLPASRTKNGKRHIVHLSQATIAVLMRMPRLGKFVFSVSGTKPFQGFSAAKRELDKLSEVTGWRLHDLAAHVCRAWLGLALRRMWPTRF